MWIRDSSLGSNFSRAACGRQRKTPPPPVRRTRGDLTAAATPDGDGRSWGPTRGSWLEWGYEWLTTDELESRRGARGTRDPRRPIQGRPELMSSTSASLRSTPTAGAEHSTSRASCSPRGVSAGLSCAEARRSQTGGSDSSMGRGRAEARSRVVNESRRGPCRERLLGWLRVETARRCCEA